MRAAVAAVITGALAGCGEAAEGARDSACYLSATGLGQFVAVPAGQLRIGADAVYAEEAAALTLHVEAFSIQVHEVTNAQFGAFVADTGYVSDVERDVTEGRPGAGSAVFRSGRWHLDPAASWRTPDGEGSGLDGRGSWPVVHVSHGDAAAYADWAGGRLPSEAEWEHAARLGLPDPARDTSGAFDEKGAPRANTWQGVFPVADMAIDGFSGTAPVGCFPPDRLGVYDMIGNVWEWTDTPFTELTYTIKGGSYLCTDNFCRRFRPAARQPQETEFSTGHIGFRIIKDIDH